MPKLQTQTVAGITYLKPTVTLLQETGIGTAEIAARTCYDSFDNSENEAIKLVNDCRPANLPIAAALANDIPHSDLLDTLAWTHFHHSILEHSNLTYLIKGMSRGALQEQARHRIQSISVRSTRYTMSSIINAFVAAQGDKEWFINTASEMNIFVVADTALIEIELTAIFDKLSTQSLLLGSDDTQFNNLAVAKSSLDYMEKAEEDLSDTYICDRIFKYLQAGKKKRNVGDAFKHIVSDNWKVDLVVTFNVRSLKNYLTLRDSGAAFFQIRWVAEAIKAATPSKYLDLIIKG